MAGGEEAELRPTTHTSYSQQVRQYLIPLLGHYRLDRLRAAHVRTAFEKIAEQAEEIAANNAARHAVAAAAKNAWRDHNAPAARAARAKLAAMPPSAARSGPPASPGSAQRCARP